MKKNLLLSLMFGISVTLVACNGDGQNNSISGNYYSASNTSYYQIESSNNQLSLNIISTTSAASFPLTFKAVNSYTFGSGGVVGTLTMDNNNIGISFQSAQSTWIDFATLGQNLAASLPNGTYNLVCDQTNLSACQLVVNNGTVSITEYSTTGQQTQLCQNSSVTPANLNSNPNLQKFTCGVNGGSTSGTWYAQAFTIESTTGIMLNEFNPTTNSNNDETDEIAFPISMSINPSGTYYYVYYGGATSSGVGSTTAQFSSAGIINSVVGLCSGAACALIQNQYYNSNTLAGFDWYNVNGLNNYNLVGNDTMGIYQDSFEGFYF